MKTNLHGFDTFLFLFILACIPGCKPKPVTKNIIIGKSIEVASKTISSTGGDIVINKPGSLVDGLIISVPPGSYIQDQQFNISYAPIEGGSNLLTPLIIIDNKEVFSKSIIKVTVPVKVSPGKFAMPFIYHEETGYFEGLPLLSVGKDKITFATRHFSKIVVAETDKTIVNNNYETEFKPGIDDWQMGNPPGISPNSGGQCSGESIAMIWYYNEKRKKGEAPLYGRYDNDGVNKTPGFWNDDVPALQFCALLEQEDWVHRFDHEIVSDSIKKLQSMTDEETMLQFASAFDKNIKENNKPLPQFLLLDREGTETGHAVVVYKMENGTLFIADPNVPGKSNMIEFDKKTNKYKPYTSKEIRYTNFTYLGEFALLPVARVAAQWKKMQDGTIGEDENDYPKYELKIKDANEVMLPLSEGMVVPEKLSIFANSKNKLLRAVIFNDHYQLLQEDDMQFIHLPPGKQRIGVEVRKVDDGEWIGFKWVKVIVGGEQSDDFKTYHWEGDWMPESGENSIYKITHDGSGGVFTDGSTSSYLNWGNCFQTTTRETFQCHWSATYNTSDYSMIYGGKITFTMKGDRIEVSEVEEGLPEVTWNPGIKKYTLPFYDGEEWHLKLKRK